MPTTLWILTLCLSFAPFPQDTAHRAPEGAAAPEWRLGVQAWTFRKYTFFEAVDKTASLGLRFIEAYPGQPLGNGKADSKLHHTMSAELRKEALRKLEAAGVRVVNYGVVGLPNDEAECRRVFDFARAMGIETVVSEPPPDALDLVDRLAREYRIHVAFHNHPKPSRYWNPDAVLEAVKGRSEWLGACADTGHWMRSGIRPIDAVKKLRGRIVSFHLKDLNEFGVREAHDVPWGTGVGNLESVLKELRAQGFRGVFSVEYEHHWETSVPEIRQSVEFFRKVEASLR